MFRRIWLGLLLLGVGGCGFGLPGYATRYTYAPGDLDRHGIVVIGQGYNCPYPQSVYACGVNRGAYWLRLDPGNPSVPLSGGHSFSAFSREPKFAAGTMLAALNFGCVTTGAKPVEYNVFKAEPGDYALFLSYAVYQGAGNAAVDRALKYYIQGGPTQNFAETAAPKFHVAAGQVLYIGDVIVSDPRSLDVVQVRDASDKARDALADAPALAAKLETRLVEAGSARR